MTVLYLTASQVVEDISVNHSLTGVLPKITICPLPGYDFSDPVAIQAPNLEELCADYDSNYTLCLDSRVCVDGCNHVLAS